MTARYLHRPPPRHRHPSTDESPAQAPVVVEEPAPVQPDVGQPPVPAEPPRPPRPPRHRHHAGQAARPWSQPERIVLAVLAALALALRLREPLSSPVLGAEDPYSHLERTWNLVQGLGISDYPPGFMVLLAPLTLLGPAGFYDAARFLPPFAGVSLVVGTYLLARRWIHPVGAATAAGLLAVVPESIRRTDLLFPTALDLALLPWALILLLEATAGRRWAGVALVGLAGLAATVHPWVVPLMGVPFVAFAAVVVLHRGTPRTRALAVAGAVAGAAALALLAGTLGWSSQSLAHAIRRLGDLVSDPRTLTPLPVLVDLPRMLTVPLLGLGAIGAGVAIAQRTRFGLLALLVSVPLLPLVLVDWFDVWYLPHRTVAYLAVGLALLAGIAIGALADALRSARPQARRATLAVVLAVVAAGTLPAAATMEPWYRTYEPADLAAWSAIAADDPGLVAAASWQARMGYRATTGLAAEYDPGFFTDDANREHTLREHPGLVVLVDGYARDAGVPLEFLDDWRLLGSWGRTAAYAPPEGKTA